MERREQPAVGAAGQIDAMRRLYGDDHDTHRRSGAGIPALRWPTPASATILPTWCLMAGCTATAWTGTGRDPERVVRTPPGRRAGWRLWLLEGRRQRTWCARSRETLTPAERDAHRRRMEAARRERDASSSAARMPPPSVRGAYGPRAARRTLSHPSPKPKGRPTLSARQRRRPPVLPVRDFASRRLMSLAVHRW
ncbi:MAG: hypothetical protein U5L11_11695 [Arhodomonas sp.]|nr:hypothetical protein [Arhodomonas sp.]